MVISHMQTYKFKMNKNENYYTELLYIEQIINLRLINLIFVSDKL